MSQVTYVVNLSASRRPRLVRDAIILGKDTVLARQVEALGCAYVKRPDEAVLCALLSVAYGKRISPTDSLPNTILKAVDLMPRNPNQTSELLASLPEPPADSGESLSLAARLLKSGTRPADLAKAMRYAGLGLLPTPAYSDRLTLCDQGVVLGKGTVIAALADHPGLVVEGQEGRILALLSVARDDQTSPELLRKFTAASRALARGEVALAAIHLCHIGQPPLPHTGFAKSLDLAARELDRGTHPFDLLKGLGLLPGEMGYGEWSKLAKCDADNAFVSTAGQWELMRKDNEEHYPAGDSEGRGGEFAPKGGGGEQVADAGAGRVPSNRDIDSEAGKKVVAQAEKWKGTMYAPDPLKHPGAEFSEFAGKKAVNQTAADCSGSVWAIYRDSGLNYTYTTSHGFESEAATGAIPFRKVDTEKEEMQPGDVVVYGGHMAIYAGKDENGNDTVWNARDIGERFANVPMRIKRAKIHGVYRYQKPPGAPS